jgi:hypothetical protein
MLRIRPKTHRELFSLIVKEPAFLQLVERLYTHYDFLYSFLCNPDCFCQLYTFQEFCRFGAVFLFADRAIISQERINVNSWLFLSTSILRDAFDPFLNPLTTHKLLIYIAVAVRTWHSELPVVAYTSSTSNASSILFTSWNESRTSSGPLFICIMREPF